jgi:hypothetical protein
VTEPALPEASSLANLIAQQEIRDVLHRYCRGVDRRQWELVRSCYHVGATDSHGVYDGDAGGFIDVARVGMTRYESTMHFMGNPCIEITGDTARSETYTIAYHRLAGGSTPSRDLTIGLRYVDDFAYRAGKWKIATRICVYEWSRIDEVQPGGMKFTSAFWRGRADSTDVVFADSLADLSRPARSVDLP